MATSWISCNACSTSDPTRDTVKVDPKLLNKENIQPLQTAGQREAIKAHREEAIKAHAEEQRQREEARRRKDEAIAAAATEAARQHEEAERSKAGEEAARREAEIAARHEAAQQSAAERAREEDAAGTAAAAASAAAQEERWRQQVAEEQARYDAQEKVNAWCKQNGYQSMNKSKYTYRGCVKFPLHTAVKHSNQEIIGMMLLAGVDKDVKDSNIQTPRELAAKLNKNGSHGQILTMLC